MTNPSRYPLLDQASTPDALRQLRENQLPALAHELRDFLIDSVAQTGGHFAAGLGTVELTIALHYVFQTPDDQLVWDVGHQCYPHKILTGRRDRMNTIRQEGGLAAFPTRDESEFDSFGVGHAGTSIGAAIGMAESDRVLGRHRRIVAIIGDGAMTSGMAIEALNHGGDIGSDVLVILNDNNMSISPNVGAISGHLTRLLSSELYSSVRDTGKRVLAHLPPMHSLARRAEEHVKGMVTPATLFEEMGFNYFGPVDGHDVRGLTETLRNLKNQKGPRLLHLVTQKGKGYRHAEQDPVAYHGVAPFDRENGLSNKPKPDIQPRPTYTQVFSDWLCDMAEQEPRLVGITPAMREGSGLVDFARRFPERYFDVAIAEQHAVTLAAGMAAAGALPVVAIYSTFLQRGYDQLIHDVALQNLPVVFAIDRAGVVGPDGATHAGSFDLSFMRCIPNMIVMTPSSEDECRQMLYTAVRLERPVAVRYPRGKGPGVRPKAAMQSLELGKSEALRDGRKDGKGVAILLFGALLEPAREAADAVDASLINMRFVKPLDTAMIDLIAREHALIVTLEDNAIQGGAGSAVNEYLGEQGMATPILNLGLPDSYLEHATRERLLSIAGLDAAAIIERIKARLETATDDSARIEPGRRRLD